MTVDEQLAAALDSLERVLRFVRRTGGFCSPEDQAMLREAEATLREAGRSARP